MFFCISFLSIFSYLFRLLLFTYTTSFEREERFQRTSQFFNPDNSYSNNYNTSSSQSVLEEHCNFFLPCFYRYNPIYRMKFPFWRAQRGSRNYNCVSSAFNEPILPTSAGKTLLKYLFSLATFYATSYPVLT